LGLSNDAWSFLWGSPLCQSRKVYKFLIGHRQVHATYKWLWTSSCQNKRKFFFWLVLRDGLSTRSLLRRRNMHLPDYNCVFYNLNIEKDLLHLLFHYPITMACWYSLNLIVPNLDDIFIILEGLKIQIRLPFFMEIIITMCWAIWMMRNDIIFRDLAHSIYRCKTVFKQEFALLSLRAKASFHPCIDQWLEAFV
jgi:hypothetical protein